MQFATAGLKRCTQSPLLYCNKLDIIIEFKVKWLWNFYLVKEYFLLPIIISYHEEKSSRFLNLQKQMDGGPRNLCLDLLRQITKYIKKSTRYE